MNQSIAELKQLGWSAIADEIGPDEADRAYSDPVPTEVLNRFWSASAKEQRFIHEAIIGKNGWKFITLCHDGRYYADVTTPESSIKLKLTPAELFAIDKAIRELKYCDAAFAAAGVQVLSDSRGWGLRLV